MLQTRDFLSPTNFMFSGVTNAIGSISQNKQQLNTSNKNVNLHKTLKILNIHQLHKIKIKWLVLLTKSSVSIELFNLPPLLDTRRQSTMQCEIPNDFFLPEGKNTQLSQIVNTWTFNRLIPNGNEAVGVQMDYLECTYKTKYYVIDKVNGQINAIHDDSLGLTEFKGHFSPFDLDDLELKVCMLAVRNKYEDDLPEPQDTLQGCDSNSNLKLHNLEELTAMGFDENNYSPIPPVGNASSQQGAE